MQRRTLFTRCHRVTGSRLNFAENLLRFDDDRVAIIATGEYIPAENAALTITYAQLRKRVTHAAASLRAVGVTVGDRIAAYVPNCTEAVVLMLAAASIGAVWSSSSPDFGVAVRRYCCESVHDRVV